MMIFKERVHMESWYQNGEIPHNWRISLSENGWTTDEIGFLWLKEHFQTHTVSKTKGTHCLLILDGHGSYVSPEFHPN